MRDYFYGNESDSFSFFRIPKTLITDPVYKTLSTDAKLLYGLLLDRMGLSARNGWMDELGRVYIYYTINEIKRDLSCGSEKAVKLMSELSDNRIGLVEKVRQGQGKPSRIYVKRFFPRISKNEIPEVGKPELCQFEKRNSGVLENEIHAFRNPKANKTELNETDDSDINPSIDPPDAKAQLMEQLDYQLLTLQYPLEDVEALLELLTDVLTDTQPNIRIGRAPVSAQRVKERILQLEYCHVAYVLDSLQNLESPIKNIRAYLLTALYNAPGTMALYYSNAIRQKEMKQ